MYFGVDYYPEQWVFPYGGSAENPEAAWERDATLMAKAGFNVVRIGEFSWGICEPEEGKYDFSWLRRVMDIMGRHNIKVILGTPTYSIPVWMWKAHPEMLARPLGGASVGYGMRQNMNTDDPNYRRYAERLIVNLVDHQVETYAQPTASGYGVKQIYPRGQFVPVVLDGTTVGRLAVDDILP